MENLRDVLANLGTYNTSKAAGNFGIDIPFERDDDNSGCSICGNRGWLTPIVPTGHPDFGSIKACICRETMREDEMAQRLLAYSNLGYLSKYSFENIAEKGKNRSEENASAFSDAFKKSSDFAVAPKGWLVLSGPHGSGKTHLAAAIANRCISVGKPTFFIYVTDLIDHLRYSFSPDSELAYRELFDQVKNSPILILDGVSSRTSTPWAQEKLIQILNHRAAGKMPTVVTTAEKISSLDPFIKSRIEDRELSQLIVTGVLDKPESQISSLETVPNGLRRMNFESFDIRGRPGSTQETRSSLENAFKTARAYSRNPEGWLTLFSPTSGSGKTHLAVAIASAMEQDGKKIFFAFVPELMDYLRSAFSPSNSMNSGKIFDEVKRSSMLILDDLGVERDSEWSQERLYQIIVHRQNYRLPTVITTRTDFTIEARRGSATASRIQDSSSGQVLKIDAPDYRLSV